MIANSYTGAPGADERLPPRRAILGRSWSLMLSGAVLTGLAIAFFVITSVRDDDLLRSGERTSAVVVRSIPAGSWNLFDCGRLVVSYQTAQGPQLRQIWLDDDAHLQDRGTRVTVVFDPGKPSRVRTVRDANDPVPWGQPILIAGLLGAIAFIFGLRNVIRSASDRRDARRRRKSPADGGAGGETGPGLPRTGRDVPVGMPLVPESGQPAWSHPRTRQAWRQYRTRVLALAAIAAVLTVVTVVVDRAVGDDDADLLAHGDRTTGVVVDGGGYGSKSSQDWVRVLYVVDGKALVGNLHGPNPHEFPTGTNLEVQYDPAKPTRFRTDGSAERSGD